MAVYGRAQLHDLGEAVARLPRLFDDGQPAGKVSRPRARMGTPLECVIGGMHKGMHKEAAFWGIKQHQSAFLERRGAGTKKPRKNHGFRWFSSVFCKLPE